LIVLRMRISLLPLPIIIFLLFYLNCRMGGPLRYLFCFVSQELLHDIAFVIDFVEYLEHLTHTLLHNFRFALLPFRNHLHVIFHLSPQIRFIQFYVQVLITLD